MFVPVGETFGTQWPNETLVLRIIISISSWIVKSMNSFQEASIVKLEHRSSREFRTDSEIWFTLYSTRDTDTENVIYTCFPLQSIESGHLWRVGLHTYKWVVFMWKSQSIHAAQVRDTRCVRDSGSFSMARNAHTAAAPLRLCVSLFYTTINWNLP